MYENSEEEVKIWTHINANKSKDFYYVYQDWNWSKATMPLEINTRRSFSFLGFYRKYSEADIFEMMRLKKLIRDQMAIKQIEPEMFFCDFFGTTSFSVFYKDVAVLQYIVDWL